MPNIPRRKIYEIMLEYEDSIIELQILLLNNKNFENKKHNLKNIFDKLEKSFIEIKALFIMFFENQKFEDENTFNIYLKNLLKDNSKVDEKLFINENLKENFIDSMKKINEIFNEKKEIKTIEELKIKYTYFDKFNHIIPDILTIRRDKMK